ncbi:MAG TPA: heme biosynthesis HemY N-terminal domain-containing protein [Burkholderiaceae bacterium]|nr:heme biosynthesis HemY N-terminal domain-containing protein [Burkholderiaceae bacterium]
MPVKAVFWLVGLFAAAAALALLMGQNGATVTLFWPPYRVDMSFNLVLGSVLALFVLVYLALRSVAALRSLPREARRWRALQRERAVYAGLSDAMLNQLAGRYVRARSAAQSAVDHVTPLVTQGHGGTAHRQAQVLAHLVAAEAAQALQDHDKRDAHFEAALKGASEADAVTLKEAVLLRALTWAVDNNRAESAQRWLSQLPQGAARRTATLRLKLKLTRLTQDHIAGFETARLLAKHRAFSETASVSILRRLRMAAFKDCHDADQLRAVWRGMDRAEQRDPALVLAIVERLREVSAAEEPGDGSALVSARNWVEPLVDQYPLLSDALRDQFVRLMVDLLPGIDAHWLGRIETLQRAHPADAGLLFLAAETFFFQKLWGKAGVAYQQATRSLTDPALKARAWHRLAQLADQRGDTPAALAAWREAASCAMGGKAVLETI